MGLNARSIHFSVKRTSYESNRGKGSTIRRYRDFLFLFLQDPAVVISLGWTRWCFSMIWTMYIYIEGLQKPMQIHNIWMWPKSGVTNLVPLGDSMPTITSYARCSSDQHVSEFAKNAQTSIHIHFTAGCTHHKIQVGLHCEHYKSHSEAHPKFEKWCICLYGTTQFWHVLIGNTWLSGKLFGQSFLLFYPNQLQ